MLPFARPSCRNDRLSPLHLREEIAAEIERLIIALDELDGDPDLEPSLGGQPSDATRDLVDIEGDFADDEPSLGSLDGRIGQSGWADGVGDGREQDDADLEDGSDDELSGDEGEPSLGSFDRMIDQSKSYRQTAGWFRGEDLEHDDCDREDNGDREPAGDECEPSMGSLDTREDQRGWSDGDLRDREIGD